MKPLNDKELKNLLRKKLGSLDPIESDHLWAGIEDSLPVGSSTGIAAILLKATFLVRLHMDSVHMSSAGAERAASIVMRKSPENMTAFAPTRPLLSLMMVA